MTRWIGVTVLPRGLVSVGGLGLQLRFLGVADHVAVWTERGWSEGFEEEAEISLGGLGVVSDGAQDTWALIGFECFKFHRGARLYLPVRSPTTYFSLFLFCAPGRFGEKTTKLHKTHAAGHRVMS